MKKLKFNNIWLVLAMSLSLTACLKDKGYEDGEYGSIKNTDGQEWLSIPVAARNPNVVGLESKAGAQNVELFVVSYDYVEPAATDISATITVNNGLVTNPDVIILPASTYTIPTNTITVEAGQRVSEKFVISLNTSTLDPTKQYGIGFTLSNPSKNGVKLSQNLTNVVYHFTLKNKYDGIYTAKFSMDPAADRSQDWRGPYTYGYDIHMITTGPNSVRMFNTAFNAGYHPLMTPGASGFGSTEAHFIFDDNNKLVDVVNLATGTRSFRLNPAVTDSRYDPATKTIYAAIIMDQTGFQPLPIYDTLIWKRARP